MSSIPYDALSLCYVEVTGDFVDFHDSADHASFIIVNTYEVISSIV
jgi:hypothetical protein